MQRISGDMRRMLTVLGAVSLTACGSGSSTKGAGPAAGGANGTGGGPGDAGAGAGAYGGSSVAPQVLAIAIDPSKTHPISELVYGITGHERAGATRARLVRLGGNRLTAYNWELDATNGGKGYGFSNGAFGDGAAPGGAVTAVLGAAAANGGGAVIAVPVGDYVAADTTPGDVRIAPDYLTTRFRSNKPAKAGPPSLAPDTSDDAVYQDELAYWVKSVAKATPVVFTLDNQPELWPEDHPEIHPAATTYDEVVSRNVAFAKALKATWHEAEVTGYASYGWEGYVNLQNCPDSAEQGEFISYYLEHMRSAEQDAGARLLDYLDLHWWPEARGGGVRITGADAGPEVVQARLQAPRSLWDASYREDSWISEALAASGENIELIARMKSRIAQHYPGTKLALSAWYYGGGGDISGALATADVLGIFGREGVDLAAVDLSGGDDSFTEAAFRAFLDFDGEGGRFGDTAIGATTNDVIGSSAYASTSSGAAGRLVIVAINKRPDARPTRISIGGNGSYASLSMYTLTSDTADLVPASAPVAASQPNVFAPVLPPMSVSVLVAGP